MSCNIAGTTRRMALSARRCLIGVLIGAAALRAAMLGMYVFNDEFPVVGNVLTFFRDRTIVPSHFAYPTLFSYLATLPTLAGACLEYALGVIPSVNDVGSPLELDWVIGVLPARLTSTVFALLTVLVVYD